MILKAAQFAEKQREKCLENRSSLIFETVLSAPDKIDFIQRAKQQDYFIRLFFYWYRQSSNTENSIQRH